MGISGNIYYGTNLWTDMVPVTVQEEKRRSSFQTVFG